MSGRGKGKGLGLKGVGTGGVRRGRRVRKNSMNSFIQTNTRSYLGSRFLVWPNRPSED